MATAVIKTLDDIIYKNDRYDINKLTFYTAIEDYGLIIRDTDLFEMYMRVVMQYVQTYSVSDYQMEHYRFRPHLLSLDIYGTPELVWLILSLNDQECPSKFTLKKTIRLVPAEIIGNLYDTIMTRSTDRLNENWNQYLTQVEVKDDSQTS